MYTLIVKIAGPKESVLSVFMTVSSFFNLFLFAQRTVIVPFVLNLFISTSEQIFCSQRPSG